MLLSASVYYLRQGYPRASVVEADVKLLAYCKLLLLLLLLPLLLLLLLLFLVLLLLLLLLVLLLLLPISDQLLRVSVFF